MARTLEFYFDYGSPYSYLADTQVEAIAQRTGATLVRKPMLLGGVFKATGGSPPGVVIAKGRWMNEDMQRWAARDGIALGNNPYFPLNTITLMRILAGLQGDERFEAVTDTLFAGMWLHGRNMADPEVLAATLTDAPLAALSLGSSSAYASPAQSPQSLKFC